MNSYILKKIYSWFYPEHCLVCGKYIEPFSYFCNSCTPDYLLERYFNIKHLRNNYFLKVIYFDTYKDFVRDCVINFKFNEQTVFAKKFMEAYYPLLKNSISNQYDYICYVPMTKKKQKARGFNQSKILAKRLSKLSGIPTKSLLIKNRETLDQHILKAKERQKNLNGAFHCVCDLTGKRIILIDDIITTGTTMCQCTKTLYAGNAQSVLGICIAGKN